MTKHNEWKDLLKIFGLILLLMASTTATADDVLGYLTDKDGNIKYIGPSVEDNVVSMDTDKNGFADVFEVRTFLELKHGKGYEKDLLDKLEASANGKSCSTPFAKELYVDKSNPDTTNRLNN